MRRVLLAVGLLLLVVVPAAHAGGWATVGLSSTPAGTEPGKPWVVDMTIRQHGRNLLEGLKPTVTIIKGDARETFSAAPTDKPGVYRASVVFPTAGRWTYEINDGFVTGMPHTFPAVQIGGGNASAPVPASAPGDDGGPSLVLLVPGIALLLGAAFLLTRDWIRRREHHQPQAA